MKLIISIIQDQDFRALSDIFLEKNIRSTRLSSTGGFLSSGNTTLLIGVEETRVDEVIALLKQYCHTRTQLMNAGPMTVDFIGVMPHYPVEVIVGGAIIFVLDAECIDLEQTAKPESQNTGA
ncbi:MAG: cyclic-di-AMP receptor [Negativicutes bacterium]|nr:cyclic-di-AMP receptor [Negativicutes bacterium]